jgi:hypothetical protein
MTSMSSALLAVGACLAAARPWLTSDEENDPAFIARMALKPYNTRTTPSPRGAQHRQRLVQQLRVQQRWVHWPGFRRPSLAITSPSRVKWLGGSEGTSVVFINELEGTGGNSNTSAVSSINGMYDALFNALATTGFTIYRAVDYVEHYRWF